jgi:hypothetical protein
VLAYGFGGMAISKIRFETLNLPLAIFRPQLLESLITGFLGLVSLGEQPAHAKLVHRFGFGHSHSDFLDDLATRKVQTGLPVLRIVVSRSIATLNLKLDEYALATIGSVGAVAEPSGEDDTFDPVPRYGESHTIDLAVPPENRSIGVEFLPQVTQPDLAVLHEALQGTLLKIGFCLGSGLGLRFGLIHIGFYVFG